VGVADEDMGAIAPNDYELKEMKAKLKKGTSLSTAQYGGVIDLNVDSDKKKKKKKQ